MSSISNLKPKSRLDCRLDSGGSLTKLDSHHTTVQAHVLIHISMELVLNLA
jgi:hypothetical protein